MNWFKICFRMRLQVKAHGCIFTISLFLNKNLHALKLYTFYHINPYYAYASSEVHVYPRFMVAFCTFKHGLSGAKTWAQLNVRG